MELMHVGPVSPFGTAQQGRHVEVVSAVQLVTAISCRVATLMDRF